MPKNSTTATDLSKNEVKYDDNYILLFLDNLDLDNYKVSTNNGITLFRKITSTRNCWKCIFWTYKKFYKYI